MLKNMKRVLVVFLALALVVCTSFAPREDAFAVKTVVIDAGHGGKDGGCVGSYSNEKDIALAISLKLGNYIKENFEDVNVIYTRKTDVFIELYERAKIANRNKADLFICVHVNSGGSASAKGTETYVMGLHKTESNLRVAQRENASILLEEDYETKYESFDPNSPESYIALTLRQSAFLDQSVSFAKEIQEQFEKRVGRVNRGVKQAGFLVLHQTAMPSVLIETGFLTNPDEEKFLNSTTGQDYMASAIYRAFKTYKKGIEEKQTNDEPVVKKEKEPKKEKIEEKQPVVESKGKDKDKHNAEEVEAGLWFKVQIATSSEKLALTPDNFNGLEGVDSYFAGDLYRYTYGKKQDFEEITKVQNEVRSKGFKDAFVVAFRDGERISVSQALHLVKGQ